VVKPPAVAASADELVAGATSRTVVHPGDARSGSTFELIELGGERYFLKTVSYADDWIMRVTHDRDHRTFKIWTAGLMQRAPSCIDHAVVGMAVTGEGHDAPLSILMRDIGPLLIPEGDDVIDPSFHDAFMDHLAGLSATFWEWEDDIGLTTMAERVRFFAPDNIAAELVRPDVSPTLQVADQGWARLATSAPELAALAASVHADPAPLVRALEATPATFLHGDWKMGNLGHHADGRTILLDWAYPGAGPACWDLCWYLALNRARLPTSKEATIDAFRARLEERGVATDGWWDAQLGLCLVGMMAAFGWEKAVGDDDELRWWERAALAGSAYLGP
jgi:hypothetical protein